MTLRALVVDDSVALRKSVIYALQRLPSIACIEAENGAEALKLAREQRFDIILTDINMPVLDGLKFIAHFRANPENASIPIVVITTESAAADREHALKLGASRYLVKPVQSPAIVEAVRQLLNL